MKTEAIKQQILVNYNKLSDLARIQPKEENVIPVWGIVYKGNWTSGFVNQTGKIERNNSSIQILNGNEIQLQKKPFFSTWKRTLTNINKMLQNTIAQINNNDIVTKNVLNIHCVPKTTLNKMV